METESKQPKAIKPRHYYVGPYETDREIHTHAGWWVQVTDDKRQAVGPFDNPGHIARWLQESFERRMELYGQEPEAAT